MQSYITYAFTTWLSVWLSADTYSSSVLLRLTEKTDPVEAQNSSLIILQLERLPWTHCNEGADQWYFSTYVIGVNRQIPRQIPSYFAHVCVEENL